MEPTLKPGQRLRIQQQIDRREGNWVGAVEGVLLDVRSEKTGSWYAHAKDEKLWINRLRLRKDNGEITTLTVDHFTRVEVIG